jgi:DNA-binding LacI/PurR family transcriptional regulator
MMVSRRCAELVDSFRSEIGKGVYSPGEFVPPVRELSNRFGISTETARRGLKLLEQEGLLVAEPRQGFRVAASRVASTEKRPVAFVTGYLGDMSDAQPVSWAINEAVQKMAGLRGWTSLGAHSAGGAGEGVVEQLIAGGAWGVLFDSCDDIFLKTIQAADLPVVMVNSWIEDRRVDAVIQDNYRGGFLGARHLVGGGAQRLAWLGSLGVGPHGRERYAGAVAGLASRGLRLREDMCVDAAGGDLVAGVRRLLSREDRPDGIFCFPEKALAALLQVAAELQMVPERDFRMVGWVVEECYEAEFARRFGGGPVPPAVVWKASSMVDWALKLLVARREGEAGEAVRISVPTSIRHGRRQEGGS